MTREDFNIKISIPSTIVIQLAMVIGNKEKVISLHYRGTSQEHKLSSLSLLQGGDKERYFQPQKNNYKKMEVYNACNYVQSQ